MKDTGIVEDTGTISEVPVKERLDADGGPGSVAGGSEKDLVAVEEALRSPGEVIVLEEDE